MSPNALPCPQLCSLLTHRFCHRTRLIGSLKIGWFFSLCNVRMGVCHMKLDQVLTSSNLKHIEINQNTLPFLCLGQREKNVTEIVASQRLCFMSFDVSSIQLSSIERNSWRQFLSIRCSRNKNRIFGNF